MVVKKGQPVATSKPSAKPAAKPAAKPQAKEEPAERAEQIKAADFVPVWQACDTAMAVAEHFGREAIWASAFAARLRKMGVKLKKMAGLGRGSGRKLDVDELNALIEE